MRKFIIAVLLPFTLSGCALFVLGAAGETGESVAENRSLGTKVDDQVVYAAVNDQFVQSGSDGLAISATVNVRHGRVMLTGNVDSQELAQKAVAAAWKAKGVKEVINDLIVNPDATYSAAANDLLIKKNFVSRLIITKDVWYINYSSDVVAGNLYILGYVKDQAELNRVMNVARTTKGVKKVVSHLLISRDAHNDAQPAATAAPVTPVTQSPATPAVAQAPTDGTVAPPDSVNSGDLAAPPAPTTASKPAASNWR